MSEAIVIVLDVGKSVGNQTDADGVSFFENARMCATMIVERNIFSNSKNEIGLVLIGSEKTNNPLDDGDQYQHIEVAHSLQLPSWHIVKTIVSYKAPTTVDGDWLDGLVVAMDFLKSSTEGKNFEAKKIVLLTNFQADVSDDDVETIIQGIKHLDVEVNAIGPHLYYDNHEGNIVESKDPTDGEKLIATIVSQTEGVICSFEDAIPQLTRFERRKQRSVPWRATLEIGTSLKIIVVGYLKITDAKRINVKNIALPADENQSSAALPPVTSFARTPVDEEERFIEPSDDNAVPVQRDYVYKTVTDNPAPVDVKDVIEGYMFGTTIIPVSDDDKLGISYQSGEKCLHVLGFTHFAHVPQRYHMGKGCMCFFPEREKDNMNAFSALFQAMHSNEMVAIVRKVYRKGACPQIGALFPEICKEHQCLVYIQLPFSQDVRTLVFPPLVKDNCAPSLDQLSAVDQLINAMDLMALEDDIGDSTEAYHPEKILDPSEQHFCHFVANKILRGDSLVKASEALETVKEMLIPKKEVSLKATPALRSIEQLFKLKEIKQKEGTRRAAIDEFKGDVKLEDKDPVDDNLSNIPVNSSDVAHTAKIGTLQPQEDFLNLIAQGTEFHHVCNMMQSVITAMVDNAFDEDDFKKPLKALIALRKECVSRDPVIYNKWMVKLKDNLLDGKTIFWDLITNDRLGLISSEESDKSSTSREEADVFLTVEENVKVTPPSEPMEEDLDDLINQM